MTLKTINHIYGFSDVNNYKEKKNTFNVKQIDEEIK